MKVPLHKEQDKHMVAPFELLGCVNTHPNIQARGTSLLAKRVRAWLQRTAFTDVGPKVLVSYYGHSEGAQFLYCRVSKGEDSKTLPTKGEGRPSVLLAYKTPVLRNAKN